MAGNRIRDRLDRVPDSGPPSKTKSSRLSWARRAAAMAIMVSGAFIAGAQFQSATHTEHNLWSALGSRIARLDSPTELGIGLFLIAMATLVVIISILLWKAGNRAIEGASSQREKIEVLDRISAMLLKVLRVSGRDAALTREPDDPFSGPDDPFTTEDP
jgi:hypothetical protein